MPVRLLHRGASNFLHMEAWMGIVREHEDRGREEKKRVPPHFPATGSLPEEFEERLIYRLYLN